MIKKADIFAIAVIVLAALLSMVAVAAFKPAGTMVVVKLDDQMQAEYSLFESKEIPITSEYGTNILKIHGGSAQIVSADCRDAICVKSGKISKVGDCLVCLPHKLVIEIQ